MLSKSKIWRLIVLMLVVPAMLTSGVLVASADPQPDDVILWNFNSAAFPGTWSGEAGLDYGREGNTPGVPTYEGLGRGFAATNPAANNSTRDLKSSTFTAKAGDAVVLWVRMLTNDTDPFGNDYGTVELYQGNPPAGGLRGTIASMGNYGASGPGGIVNGVAYAKSYPAVAGSAGSNCIPDANNWYRCSLPIPAIYVAPTTFYIQFNLSDFGTLSEKSAIVFDYVALNTPTAVTMITFTGEPAANGAVNLAWETAIENNLAGFNLYRADVVDGPYNRINTQLIAAQGNGAGASYNYTDQPGIGTFFYKIEDVDASGNGTLHDAIMVSNAPTAVNVTALSGTSARGFSPAWLLGGLAVLGGLALVVTRRKPETQDQPPYETPQVTTYTDEQILEELGPAQTGGYNVPFP